MVILQIEDAEALDVIDEVAAVPGVDALFIGRADLTVSLEASSQDDPIVVEAVRRILTACRSAGRRAGMFLGRVEDVAEWRREGASLFNPSSDQEFMLRGAAGLA